MKDLVDVLYYDYILYRLAGLYTSDGNGETKVQYQKIAQKILTKLRSDKVVLDAEVGLKFAYIKIHDLHQTVPKCEGKSQASCCRKHYLQFLATCCDYLTRIMTEYSALKECEEFKQLLKLTSLLFVFVFQTLSQFANLEGMEKGPQHLKSYLSKEKIEMKTEDEFRRERKMFLKSQNICTDSEDDILNKSFECMMEKLKKIFLTFDIPALQFFATREAMRLQEIYPNMFEDFEGIPASTGTHREEIVKDYLEVRNSLNKARGTYMNPKDKGEKVAWSQDTQG